jgi:hexosaminidase
MDEFLAAHGRSLIGWDEILEGGLAANATVMSWRGMAGGLTAAAMGHDVIMADCEHTYLDYYQTQNRDGEPLAYPSTLTMSKVYGYDPVPAELPAEHAYHILGAQGQLWTEYIPTPEQLEYQAFPRLCALAEVTWTEKCNKNYYDFVSRFETHARRLDRLQVNYRPISRGEGGEHG